MSKFRLQLRFLAPLVLVLRAAAWIAGSVLQTLTGCWSARDLDMRGSLVASTLEDSIITGLREHRSSRLESVFEKPLRDERL